MKTVLIPFFICLFSVSAKAQDPKLILPVGHAKRIQHIEFSNNDKIILTASYDNTVKIWDSNSGMLLLNIKDNNDSVITRLGLLSPDSKTILTYSFYNWHSPVIRLWSIASGKQLSAIDFEADLCFDSTCYAAVQFSSDSKRIIFSGQESFRIWNISDGKLLYGSDSFSRHNNRSFLPGGIIKISPDGSSALKCLSIESEQSDSDNVKDNSVIGVWKIDSAKMVVSFKKNGRYTDVNFSKMGSRIIAINDNGSIDILSSQTGIIIKHLVLPETKFLQATLNEEEDKIETISLDKTIEIWSLQSGKLLQKIQSPYIDAKSVIISPDGSEICLLLYNDSLKKFDVKTSRFTSLAMPADATACSFSFSHDSKRLAVGFTNGTVEIYSTKTNVSVARLTGRAPVFLKGAITQDSRRIITVCDDNTLKIWSVENGQLLASRKIIDSSLKSKFSIEISPGHSKKIIFLDQHQVEYSSVSSNYRISETETYKNWKPIISQDSKRVLINIGDSTAKLWSTEDGKLLAKFVHNSVINSARFSPNNNRIVTTSWDSTAKLWSAYDGHLVAALKQTSLIDSTCFSPEGKTFLIVSSESGVKLYSAETGAQLYDTKQVEKSTYRQDNRFSATTANNIIASEKNTNPLYKAEWQLKSVSYSPDGKKIIIVFPDHAVKIITENGELLVAFKRDNVKSASFSPDGKMILMVFPDHMEEAWEENEKLLSISENSYITDASFSKDGKKIAVSFLDNDSIKIYRTEDNFLLNQFRNTNSPLSFLQRFNGLPGNNGKFILQSSGNDSAILLSPVSAEGNVDVLLNLALGSAISGAAFSPDDKILSIDLRNDSTKVFSTETGILLNQFKNNKKLENEKANREYVTEFVITADTTLPKRTLKVLQNGTATIWDNEKGQSLYNILAIDSSDYLTSDSLGHFDGTDNARKLLYFTCGTEIIELDQVKDQLWVPNLAERIIKGETINAPKLSDLNICNLTPLIESSEQDDSYRFYITPRQGGIGETVLYVNGIEVKSYLPDQLTKTSEGYKLIVTKSSLQSYFLTGKENDVSIKSYTQENTISSRGLHIVQYDTAKQTMHPNLYAVMVGISDYKGTELDLKYAAKDATDLSKAVAASAGKLLNNNGQQHVFVYNINTGADRTSFPEKQNIRQVLKEIGKKATADDILLLFFAGHGVLADEAGKKQFYFLTADASTLSAADAVKGVGISTTELTEWVKPQNIKAQKRILIFDACNSGQAINDITGSELAVRNDDKAQQIKVIDKLNERSGLFILSASASNKPAYEMGQYSQGLLTYSLLKTMKQQPDILDEGKYLNVSRWFEAAEKTVENISEETGARQQPQMVSNTNFNVGIVDDDVMKTIALPNEKPVFALSNLQNNDEAISADDLELSKKVNNNLSSLSARGIDNTISFIPATNTPDAYTINGRYDVKGDTITVRINIRQHNKLIEPQFEVKGTQGHLDDLAETIVKKAIEIAGHK